MKLSELSKGRGNIIAFFSLSKESLNDDLIVGEYVLATPLYLTNILSVDEKMKFYNSVMDNNLELFKALLLGEDNKHYDIFEEVSAPGYKWTVFHYAMHYGKWEIINYIIEYLQDYNLIDIAFKMKTNDNRCPMLCLLKSNYLSLNQKRDLYSKN